MEEDKKIDTVVDEEASLDKMINDSINTVKAGSKLEENPEVKPEEKKEETPTNPKVEDTTTPPENGPKDEKYEFKMPVPSKTKFESDEAYEKRVELMQLINQKKLTKSEDQKQKLSEKIQETREEMGILSKKDNINNTLNKSVESTQEEDETLKADRERLKQLGGATKEDIQEILRQERFEAETRSTLKNFIERHPELKDDDVREVFFEFTENNFNINGKSGKDLMTVLELARESMFPKQESIQERVLKGANVQEKINAMQFPGGTVTKPGLSKEMQDSIEEMKKAGISEAKALELLSD